MFLYKLRFTYLLTYLHVCTRPTVVNFKTFWILFSHPASIYETLDCSKVHNSVLPILYNKALHLWTASSTVLYLAWMVTLVIWVECNFADFHYFAVHYCGVLLYCTAYICCAIMHWEQFWSNLELFFVLDNWIKRNPWFWKEGLIAHLLELLRFIKRLTV